MKILIHIRTTCALTIILFSVSACSNVKVLSKYELSDGKYWFHQRGEKYHRVDLEIIEDSINIYQGQEKVKPDLLKDQYLFQTNLDLDILYALFKYRPAESSLPRQITNSFNANLFLGYRLDRFHLKIKRTHSGKPLYKMLHRSVALGAFTGIGASTVAPWTTRYQTTDEYNGLVISRGAMLLGGINSVTVGLAVGFDRLTDRDKHIWIYQDQPWYGLTLGLTLN